jgi:hypothetical protein
VLTHRLPEPLCTRASGAGDSGGYRWRSRCSMRERNHRYPYTAPRTASAKRTGRPPPTDLPAHHLGPLQDRCASTVVAGSCRAKLPADGGPAWYRQRPALPALLGHECAPGITFLQDNVHAGTTSLATHAFPFARIPEKTLEGLTMPFVSPPCSLTALHEPMPIPPRDHGDRTPIAHCRQNSTSRPSVPRAERRCTPPARGYPPLPPIATHRLLLKPSFHARRHPHDVSVCVQTRNESYARSGGACRADLMV